MGRRSGGLHRLADGLRGLGRFDVLWLTASIWFLAKFLRYAFPPLFEPLQAGYGVSNAAVGTAFTGFMLVYAAMQFPSGVLADWLGSVRVVVGGVAFASAGAGMVAAGLVGGPLAGFFALVVTMLVMGAGTGAHKTVAIRLLARVYPSQTGRALGVLDTIGTLGGVGAPIAVVAFTTGVFSGLPGDAWRWLFLASGLVGVALAGAFLRWIPRRLERDGHGAETTGSPTSGPGVRGYARLFADRRLAAFVGVTLSFSFAYNGLVAFLPLYLTREAGFASATASGLYGLLFLLSFAQLFSGEASDRTGQLPVIVVTLGLATAGVAALVLLPIAGAHGGTLAFGAAVVVGGAGMHGFRPVRGSYLMRVLPAEIAAGGLGVVRTGLMGAGAVSPAIVGFVSDGFGFRPAFGLLAAAMTASAVVATGLWATADRP